MWVTNLIASSLFFIAAAWFFSHRRHRPGDLALIVGLTIVGAALLLRIPVVSEWTNGYAEPIKHCMVLIAANALLLFITPTMTATREKIAMFTSLVSLEVAVLTICSLANGPFATDVDLLIQTYTSPKMLPYWLTFYGGTCLALSLLAFAAFKALNTVTHPTTRFSTWALTIGSTSALLWGISGPATWIALLTHNYTTATHIDDISSSIVAVSAMTLTVGLVAPSIHNALMTRKQRGGLSYLHDYLTHLFPMYSMPGTKELRRAHHDIEIADTLTLLQQYSPPTPTTSPTPESAAHLILDAAARYTTGKPRTYEHWGWMRDPQFLSEVGQWLQSNTQIPQKQYQTPSNQH